MLTDDFYKQVSVKLFELFFVDSSKYGRQQPDGTYRLVREKASVVTIDDMLLNEKSLLTYQEYHSLNTAYIKWICIDLDIAKSEIDQNAVNKQNLELVCESASNIVSFLKSLQIPYLLEFSGRRGFHIWITFDELQAKETGYHLVNYILSNVVLKQAINADRYPKTRGVGKNTKMVGLGVKLPLSQNKVSGKLSYFLNDITDFNLNESFWQTKPTDHFLHSQFTILNGYRPMTTDQLNLILTDYINEIQSRPSIANRYLNTIKITVPTAESLLLDEVLINLRRCDHIDKLLTDYQKGIGGKERSLMVGLLGQLKSPTDENLGYNLLLEFFSRIKGFRKEITEEKLKLIQYYFPISCNQLGRCSQCTCQNIVSPVELIDGIEIESVPKFNLPILNNAIFERITRALAKYAVINDEIPLYPQIKKLENADLKDIMLNINEIYEGRFPKDSEYFKFLRNEGDKIRTLYSIDTVNNIISTFFLFILNNIFYTSISENSFGYRLAPGFYGNNIFGNWFINWSIFSKNVSHVLTNIEFEKYFVIKVDIKAFYDRIDLPRLKIKLYEEVPIAIKEKLNTLTELELRQYKSIVNYLIQLSGQTTGNVNKGLPQGPAYARYLAELYLLGLDKLIEGEIIKDKKREFYYRFVDDIFVFVETEEKANNVLKEIDKWVSTNNLELNLSKIEISNVEDYNKSGKFQKFQDDAKYLINKANKNKAILSEAEIQEALSKLENLTNDIKFGLKDNLRFFYFQFSGDSRLNHIKKKLIKFLPFSDNGRGTLYLMFYADLIKMQPDQFWSLSEQQHRITGLSLGHYLNTMLFNEESVNEHLDSLKTLIQQLSLREDLTSSDKSLIITIGMKYGVTLSDDFIKTCPKSLINSAMETPEIQYSIRDYAFIKEKLQDKGKIDFVKELYRIILQHPLSKEIAEELAKYAFLRFSEWFQQGGITELMAEEELIIQYYHVLCFFTLFDDPTESTTLIRSWENLLQQSKNIKLSKNISFDWLNRAVEHSGDDFSKSSYTLLLSNKEGSPLNKYDCDHGFLTQFQNILLVLLFSKEITLENFSTDDKSYMEVNSLFGKWLLSKEVKLYPAQDNICIKNLALNGLIVLENDSHIFIKSVNTKCDIRKFDYLKLPDNIHDNEIELTKTNKTSLYARSSSFIEYLQKVAAFITIATTFKENYKTNYPVYYKNPYTVDELPLIPYYSEFSQKISPSGTTQTNDTLSFWENINFLSKFYNADVSIIADLTNPYNFDVSKIDSRFFPKSDLIIGAVDDRGLFLNEFLEVVGDSKINNIYDFQYHWTKTVWNILSNKRKSGSDLIEYLNVHFADFPTTLQMPYDILFTVDNRTEIASENLLAFYTTIRKSFFSFNNELSQVDFSLVDILDDELNILSDYFAERDLTMVDFELAEVSFKTQFDIHSKTTLNKLLINNITIGDKPVLVFERDPIGFYKKDLDELTTRTRSKYVYTKETDDDFLIIIPELELVKAHARINERKDLYDSLMNEPSDYTKVFPKKQHFELAENEYDNFDFTKVELILKDHYSTTTNIKERVVYWLSLFNEESLKGSQLWKYLTDNNIPISKLHRAILELISIHFTVSNKALNEFTSNLKKFSGGDHLIFPLKHPNRDRNGLARMLQKAGFSEREINFENQVNKLFNEDCKGKTLVIVADVSISGSQAERSLDYYLKELNNQAEFDKYQLEISKGSEKFFAYTTLDQTRIFRSNISQIQNIIFISPIMTDKFKARMAGLPIFSGKDLKWVFTNELVDSSYNLGADNMDMDNKRIIKELISDSELIDKLFKVPDIEIYRNFNRDPNALNILLRIGSLPSKHIKVLSLKPKNGYLGLFDYIDNWRK